MDYPELPDNVMVLPGTDVDGEWQRFRVFEALHHTMTICNPMLSHDLDALVEVLDPADGDRVLDLACGHGELLMRMAEEARVDGVGVDLSPWVIARAAENAAGRPMRGMLSWWLGEARNAAVEAAWDVVTCMGASWIWHGFEGTVRALQSRGRPGARMAVGDLRLLDGVDPAAVADEHGRLQTREEQEAILRGFGLDHVQELTLDESGWDAYQSRIWESAHEWRRLHPGPEAERFIVEQEEWRRDHERDQTLLTWTVWTARVR